MKSSKDTLFFLDAGSVDEKPKKAIRKPPVLPKANGSPKKTVAGKVLRNATRRTQDEVHQTAAAKLREHQQELHEKIQRDGLEKFSEEGGGTSGKEGKGWKRFQSYKGEAALPPEVERLRVSGHSDRVCDVLIDSCSDSYRPEGPDSHPPYTRLCGTVPYQYHQECKQE